MADGRWRITVTAPDWGQDHLSSEAIVAFVDGELAPGPHARAARHLECCPDCAAQVRAQRQARSALRTAACPHLSSALLSSLRAIPQDTDLPPAPLGLAMSADGQLVSMLRPALPLAPVPRPRPRRMGRLGTGVAVSGLVLGALALSAPAAAPAPPAPAPTAEQGPLGRVGPPNAVDARLQLGSVTPPANSGERRSPIRFER